jgi:hypothetical protein
MTTDHEPTPDRAQQILDEVEQLVWGMLDDEASESEVLQMEALLLESKAARSRYLECVQLHCDLRDYFRDNSTPDTAPAVISDLTGEGLPGPGSCHQPAE